MDSDSDVVIVPLMTDETRRLAVKVRQAMYIGAPCRICRKLLDRIDDDGNVGVYVGWSRDGAAVAAHQVCWDNFVELLQTLPSQQLYELAVGPGKENDDGQRANDDRRTAL